MAQQPDFAELFERAVAEGDRRLDQPVPEIVVTSFIAGFTIVFGMIALGIVHAAVAQHAPGVAGVAGALAFGVGLVFLIVGRTELFTENFYAPAAAVVDANFAPNRIRALLRLWSLTFAFNLVGGFAFVLVLSFEGSMPPGTAEALRVTAEEIAHRPAPGRFASGFAGGALVTLLSFLLGVVETEGARIFLAYATGVLLALGPFDHVAVTVVHVGFGVSYGATVSPATLVEMALLVTAGNLVGGIGLVTTTHVAQAIAARPNER